MPRRQLATAFGPSAPNPAPSVLIFLLRRRAMQRSSASIAALASALAKAQIQLTNPEKSLVGTIEPQRGEGSARQFRYAPLSSGLEIVRKTLGQHEIATVQTTAVDQAAGIVNLTTILAHSSGEWIASDWPVCPVTETATPYRMGAALTYARRYALFTLVGIAGEDDLDAPDLIGRASPPVAGNGHPHSGEAPDPESPSLASLSRRRAGRSDIQTRAAAPAGSPQLRDQLSAVLRDELLVEVAGINGSDEAAAWAHKRMPAKNTLTAQDARLIEKAFARRLAAFEPTSETSETPTATAPPTA